MPRKYVRKDASETVAKVASVDETSALDLKSLLAEIKGLRDELAIEKKKRGDVEQAALDAAQAQGMSMLQQTDVQEVPTGKTVDVQICTELYEAGYRDDGRAILKPRFKTVKKPTYFYKIDIPPVGGLGLTVNTLPLYHGTVYEFDIDTLRSVKDMVYKCWKHDADIHGSDENVYRKPAHTTLSGKGMR